VFYFSVSIGVYVVILTRKERS